MDKKRLLTLIEQRKDELFSLLSSLIQFDSQNFDSYGKEREIAEYIHALCQELGLDSDLYSPLELDGFTEHPDYMDGRHLEDRYNVTACWRGAEDRNELMLMAHTDTVEVGDPSNWTVDPFSGAIKDGKIFGRGACDDKYALATALFIIKLLKEEGFEPKANLLFSAYVDEERGGSHGALASVLKYPSKRIVSMDGIEGQIWHCGSGGQETEYWYHTKETVDSAKRTADAIPIVLEEIEKFAARRRKELGENRFYAGTIIPETALRYMEVRAGNNANDLGVGKVFFTYYTDKSRDEIAEEFVELEKALRERLEPMGIIGDGIKPRTRFFHYVACEPDSEDVVRMVEAARMAGVEPPIVCGSCLSDLSVISKYGSDRAFGIGAGRDFSLDGGAHQPNEYIECDALVEYTKTIAMYVMDILG